MPTEARRIADTFWDQVLELNPLLGTLVGDERFDDRLEDLSPAGRARREDVHRSALGELKGIDGGSLDVEDRVTLDLVETLATRNLTTLALGYDRLEVTDHLWGPGTLLADLGSFARADTASRRDALLGRLRAVPAYLEGVAAVMDEGVATGRTAAGLVVDRLDAQVGRLLTNGPERCVVLSALPEDDSQGRAAVVDALREVVFPAYEGYRSTLRDYRASARDGIGLIALPDGEELYAAQILGFTTLSLPAKDVHELGLDQLQRIQDEKAEVARSLGAPDPETAVSRRREEGLDSFASREEIVALAREQADRSWAAAPSFFGTLPDRNCEVRAIDAQREADQPEHYIAPTADGSRPGVYYVNTINPTARPRHALATTTFHESSPGHHFQGALEVQAADRAAIRRFAADIIGMAFCEGWGLYSERLADEMGLYQDDYERLGMLEMQAFRAARLVVDTGIHALGWERQRAIEVLRSSGLPKEPAEREVDRYVSIPGQALCYKLGQLEIERWRADAAAKDGFSLQDFHDRLLSLGSLPLPTLRRELGES
jgi:uncharacterized protein (DUF885 family)